MLQSTSQKSMNIKGLKHNTIQSLSCCCFQSTSDRRSDISHGFVGTFSAKVQYFSHVQYKPYNIKIVLGNSLPSESVEIHSMVTEFIATTNNPDLIKAYQLEPFKVTVISIERTFCEKIISLVRFSYAENPLEDLANKVRHTYDLHQLLQERSILKFLKSDDFETMLIQVGKDDDKAIPNDKVWLSKHPSESLFFSETKRVWETVSKTYAGSFKELLTGELPNEKVVLKSLLSIASRVKEIKWNIN